MYIRVPEPMSLWIVVHAGQFGQIINGAVTLELMLDEYEYVVPESNTPAIQQYTL